LSNTDIRIRAINVRVLMVTDTVLLTPDERRRSNQVKGGSEDGVGPGRVRVSSVVGIMHDRNTNLSNKESMDKGRGKRSIEVVKGVVGSVMRQSQHGQDEDGLQVHGGSVTGVNVVVTEVSLNTLLEGDIELALRLVLNKRSVVRHGDTDFVLGKELANSERMVGLKEGSAVLSGTKGDKSRTSGMLVDP